MYNINDIENRLRSMLKPKRFEHTMGVKREAVRLAEKYGANTEDAELAGLLHDCCKDMTFEQLVDLAEKFEITLDPIERVTYKLIHAPVGAEYAKRIFEIENPEVLSAIAYHTTAKANMTLLEKIIYVADYAEPTRSNFFWYEKISDLAYKNLDEAVLYGLDLAIDYLIEDRMLIHENTFMARNYIVKELMSC